MSERSIRSKIAEVIAATVTVDNVYDEGVKITSEDDLISQFAYETDGSPATDAEGRRLLSGWVVFPGSTSSRALTATCGYRECTHTYRVYAYASIDGTSESDLEADVSSVVTALLTPSNFRGEVPSTVISEVTSEIGPATLVGITVWEALLTVVAVEYPH